MTFPTQLYGDYFINHEIRIPSLTNQYFMESRSFFFVAQVNLPLAFSMMLHGIRLEGKEKDVCIIFLP